MHPDKFPPNIFLDSRFILRNYEEEKLEISKDTLKSGKGLQRTTARKKSLAFALCTRQAIPCYLGH